MADRRARFTKLMQSRLARTSHGPINVCRLRALEAIARYDPPLHHFLSLSDQTTHATTTLQTTIVREIAKNEHGTLQERAAALTLLTCVEDASLSADELHAHQVDLGAPVSAVDVAERCVFAASILRYACGAAVATRTRLTEATCFGRPSAESRDAAGGIVGAATSLLKLALDRAAVVARRIDRHQPALWGRRLVALVLGTQYAFAAAPDAANTLLSLIEAAFQMCRALEAVFLLLEHQQSAGPSAARLAPAPGATTDVASTIAAASAVRGAVDGLFEAAAQCAPEVPFAVPACRALLRQALHAARAAASAHRLISPPLPRGPQPLSGGSKAAQLRTVQVVLGHHVADAEVAAATLRALSALRAQLAEEVQRALCEAAVAAVLAHEGAPAVWSAALEVFERYAAAAPAPLGIKIATLSWDRLVASLRHLDPSADATFDAALATECVELILAVLGQTPGVDQHVPLELVQVLSSIGARGLDSHVVRDGVVRRLAWHTVWCALLRLVHALLLHGGNRWTLEVATFVRTCPRVEAVLASPVREDSRGRVFSDDLVETARCASIVALCHAQRMAIPSLIPALRRGFWTLFESRADRVRSRLAGSGNTSNTTRAELPVAPEFLCVPAAKDYLAVFLTFPCGEGGVEPVVGAPGERSDITFERLHDFIMQQLGLLARLHQRDAKANKAAVESPGSPASRGGGGNSVERDAAYDDSELDGHVGVRDYHVQALQGALVLYSDAVRYYASMALNQKQLAALAAAREQLQLTLTRVERLVAAAAGAPFVATIRHLQDEVAPSSPTLA